VGERERPPDALGHRALFVAVELAGDVGAGELDGDEEGTVTERVRWTLTFAR